MPRCTATDFCRTQGQGKTQTRRGRQQTPRRPARSALGNLLLFGSFQFNHALAGMLRIAICDCSAGSRFSAKAFLAFGGASLSSGTALIAASQYIFALAPSGISPAKVLSRMRCAKCWNVKTPFGKYRCGKSLEIGRAHV